MGNLILNSLEIQGFRGFRHLQIERLGRVNLIVGKNNVGKSSLLDALQLYGYEAHPNLIGQLLSSRDESLYDPYSWNRVGEARNSLAGVKYLFHGRRDIDINVPLKPILIGPINAPMNILSLSIGWAIIEAAEEDIPKLRLLQESEYDAAENPVPRFVVSIGEQRRHYAPGVLATSRLNVLSFNCVFITANGLDRELLEEFWNGVVLRDVENDVLAALRIIAPGVERLSLAGDTNFRQLVVREGRVRERGRIAIPIVKVADISEPIPLGSLGSGMQRILGIALALVNARNGILLIDEFENGLYYSIQPSLWMLNFQIARRLNVQVFATTHSWDCIEGFQQAVQEEEQEEGLLIRLQNRKSEISATLYDKRELTIATRERIEVR